MVTADAPKKLWLKWERARRRSEWGSVWRLTCLGTLCGVALVHAAPAQSLAEAEVIALARPPIPHGFDTYSRADRLRIAADRHALAVLSRLLAGRVRTTVKWDSAVVIWWLAESGDAAYLPVFLEGSRASDTTAVFSSAVYGLVRSASAAEASQRIEELLRNGSDDTRRNTIALLAAINDADSRRLLRSSLANPGLARPLAEMATNALARPEIDREVARWPELKPQ